MTARDRVAEPWGARTPYESGEVSPTRVDAYLADGMSDEHELTITGWDPVSKQPIFKTATARVNRVGAGDGDRKTRQRHSGSLAEVPPTV